MSKKDSCSSREASATSAEQSGGACFYEFLGVERSADTREIHKAYLRMALRLHPDKNVGVDHEDTKHKFQHLQRVYNVLKNDDLRATYDRYGEAGLAENDDDEGDEGGLGAEEAPADDAEWGITLEQARSLARELLGTDLSDDVLASIMSDITGDAYRPRASNSWSAADVEEEVCSAATAKATSLPWSRRNIARLPPSVGSLATVTSMFLDRNALTTLPAPLFELTQLTVLSLNDNQLRSVPKAIGSLTALQTLQLDRNRLKALPREIGQLTSLRELSLFGNSALRQLPDVFAGLSHLKRLDAQCTGVETATLPPSVLQLQHQSGDSLAVLLTDHDGDGEDDAPPTKDDYQAWFRSQLKGLEPNPKRHKRR